MTTQAAARTVVRAWNNYVAVKLDRHLSPITPSGIYLPSVNGDVTISGTIVSIGPDALVSVPVGSTALVPPHGVGIRATIDREPYILILDYDILGVWTDSPTERQAHES